MSTSLTLIDTRMPVVMKSKLVHWVQPMTGENIQAQLQKQGGHTFMKITELGITINTAEIEGVYTIEQFEELAKIKDGMKQCIYRKWHAKKEECDCSREIQRRHQQMRREDEQKDIYRELTPDERERITQKMAGIGSMLRGKGILKDASATGSNAANGRECEKCNKTLTGNLKRYCSGDCRQEARIDGTYDGIKRLKADA